MKRMRALQALGAGVLAVTLAGCFKMDMELDVKSDDTVDGTVIMAIDKGMAGMMGGDPEDLVEQMLSDTADMPADSTAERYEDDAFIGAKYTFENGALDEFADDSEAGGSGGLSIVHEGDEFVVSGTLDLTGGMGDMGDLGEMDMGDAGGLTEVEPQAASTPGSELGSELGSDLGDLGSDLGDLGGLEDMMSSADIRISITFPGEVIDANGEIDGTTVTWVPDGTEPLELSARAKDSGGAGGLPIWAWILIGVAVIGAVVALLFFFSRNKSQPESAQAVPGDGTVPPAPGDGTVAAAAGGVAGAAAGAAAGATDVAEATKPIEVPEAAAAAETTPVPETTPEAEAAETTEVPDVPAPAADVAAEAEAPAAPEAPAVPEASAASDAPAAPEAPAAPAAPEAPEAPEVPEAPAAPEAPDVPEPPATPEPPR